MSEINLEIESDGTLELSTPVINQIIEAISPDVTLSRITGGATIMIVDKGGTHTVNVYDGEDGTNGTDGEDGYSPTVSTSSITGGVAVTITDKNGDHTFNVYNGTNGTNGTNGVSPTATVSKSGSTATISITDKNGTTTATVSDGDPSDLIDDTAGDGDTGVTWSADKLVDELAEKYEKPSGGIPGTDIASGVIPTLTDLIDDTAGDGDTDVTWSADKLSDLNSALSAKISEPQTEGTSGQVLTTDGNGGRSWTTVQGGSVDPAIIAQAVDDWLDDHPEATTTVQDGSITEKKLSEGLTNNIFTYTRNLYDKESAGAQDGKQYSSSGIVDNSYYAFTGYADCEAEKTYIFKAGNALVQMAIYMNGSTLISRERIDGASFTTPANCTKVGFNLFAANHTTDNFNDAINNAQLEEGTVSTDYVPYKVSIKAEMGSLYKTIHGKNLYDKTSCNPQDKKQIDSNGDIISSDYYAITGKIPCEGNTTYIFSIGTMFINTVPVVDKVCYFNGNNLISRVRIGNSSFTTPSNCNYVSFNLFGQTHTTEQYEDAIDTAQLEEGDTPTAYEAYVSTETESYSFITQGIGQNRNRVISQKAMTDILADPWRSSWWNNKKGDSLGDSITYKFDRFQKFVKGYLKLAEFYNNGMTGTKIAGPTDPTWGDSMWMDSRINALHADADFITILGGANDSANEDIGTVSIENCDTDTYCGAFNVIISKIYYRYLALSNGYYNTVDYTGVNQLSTPKNVIIVPCTMFYVPGGIAKLKDKADAIRTLSEAWALKVCDFYGTIQANPFVANYYWGQSDNVHPTELFYKERLAPILINALEYLKPMEFRGVE